jgi:hypothetical protein
MHRGLPAIGSSNPGWDIDNSSSDETLDKVRSSGTTISVIANTETEASPPPSTRRWSAFKMKYLSFSIPTLRPAEICGSGFCVPASALLLISHDSAPYGDQSYQELAAAVSARFVLNT